jgi:hypothetical protein
MESTKNQWDNFVTELEEAIGDIPVPQRQEILAETRSHLEAMVAARRADGMDEATAWQSAMRDFGDPGEIGGELHKEWNRDPHYETVGTAMTAREKTTKIAGGLAIGFPLFLITQYIASQLHERHLLGIACLFASCFFTWLLVSNYRKKGIPFTPALKFLLLNIFLFPASMGALNQFTSQLKAMGLAQFFILVLPIVFTMSSLGAVLWIKSEAGKTLPWRRSPRYEANPIAAEDAFNFGPTLGLTLYTAITCIYSLWRGWVHHDFAEAAILCSVQIIFALVFLRVLKRKWI